MIAYPVQVEDAMLIVPVNLPSFEVPAVPPQTASSSPSTTGNTRRDGPYERFNMRPLPRSFGAFSTAAPSAPAGTDAARGETLFQAGLLAFWRGDDDRAFALHDQALAIGRRIGDPTVTAKALTGLARIALRRTGVDEARRLCREALAITEGTADRTGRSNALHVLGVTAQMAGEFLEARKLMSERIALARETGNYATIGLEASNLAMVERQLGNLDQAEALSREALDISYRRGDDWATPLMISGLAAVATQRGELERAATLVGAAESLMEAQGFEWPPDERPHYERVVAILAEAKDSDELEPVRRG